MMKNRVSRIINILDRPIEITAVDTGAGISVVISGGDRGHIGAVGIATPGHEVQVITFPEHKETVIAEKWAREISGRTGEACVVSAGIHYDNINKEGIQAVLDAMDAELEKFLQTICEKPFTNPF